MEASTLRAPAVAGLFYPAEPRALRSMVEGFLGASPPPGSALLDGEAPKALIAPHAGYIYSGPIAASAFRLLSKARGIRRVILLGPPHHVPVRGLALPGEEAFDTPLGPVPVDPELVERIVDLPQVGVHSRAHFREHSLEVELPFLQVVLGEFSILPLLVGSARSHEVVEVLERVRGGPETLVVVSSDLSHYLPYAEAREVDRQTSRAILALEEPLELTQACGAGSINGLLAASRAWGLAPHLLDLRSSGDTAGDRQRVVGYGAWAFGEAHV